jgi:sulfate transport system ATP-binding protein
MKHSNTVKNCRGFSHQQTALPPVGQDRALAYVRPHELQVERYRAGASGIVAELQRAIVVGPIARLELWPHTPSVAPGQDRLIEAQMSCERFAELGLRQGEKLLVSPRQAKVFLQA